MISNEVFNRLQEHFKETGEIMEEVQFKREITKKFPKEEVICGILMFDKFLDENRSTKQREEV